MKQTSKTIRIMSLIICLSMLVVISATAMSSETVDPIIACDIAEIKEEFGDSIPAEHIDRVFQGYLLDRI